MDYNKLAELLFPAITDTPSDIEARFPARDLPEGTPVTRLGPSPTGFIHLGNLYGAFVDERIAHQKDGVFYLRIEDTDDKRYVEGAVETVIDSLDFFGIHFDEGAGKEKDTGEYGPYYQSQRKEIYQVFVKDLVRQGLAYPSFLTEEEITSLRTQQEAAKVMPGIYGKYAKERDYDVEQVEEKLSEGLPFVVRLKSGGNPSTPATITVSDAIRGELSMPENFQDVVILKTTGLPTYHFAHVCDDHLMKTTHVVRGEEWLSSLPIHVELFAKLGFSLPIYCHTSVLMKIDENGSKRKLSKRKDPELALDYYKELGYHPLAVKEYLLTILNSNYEEWRQENPDTPWSDFSFTMDKMSTSGALFDLNKLNDISKDVLLRIPASQLAEFLRNWAKEFRPELTEILADDKLLQILDLGRYGKKPRKDFINAAQMFQFIQYFYEEYFTIESPMPEEVAADTSAILRAYLASYNHQDDQSAWFDKIRTIATDLGYAAKPKDYKKNPDQFKGHVGHVSTVIRIALMGRSQSPDIWEIQQILGEEAVRNRIAKMI